MKMNIIKDQSKADFDFIFMQFIMRIGEQLAKLPHEFIDASSNEPMNTTHKDIITSYADMVDHLEMLLLPYLGSNYKKTSRERKTDEAALFEFARTKFGELIKASDESGLLLQKIKAKAEIEEDVIDYAKRYAEKPRPTAEISDEQPE